MAATSQYNYGVQSIPDSLDDEQNALKTDQVMNGPQPYSPSKTASTTLSASNGGATDTGGSIPTTFSQLQASGVARPPDPNTPPSGTTPQTGGAQFSGVGGVLTNPVPTSIPTVSPAQTNAAQNYADLWNTYNTNQQAAQGYQSSPAYDIPGGADPQVKASQDYKDGKISWQQFQDISNSLNGSVEAPGVAAPWAMGGTDFANGAPDPVQEITKQYVAGDITGAQLQPALAAAQVDPNAQYKDQGKTPYYAGTGGNAPTLFANQQSAPTAASSAPITYAQQPGAQFDANGMVKAGGVDAGFGPKDNGYASVQGGQYVNADGTPMTAAQLAAQGRSATDLTAGTPGLSAGTVGSTTTGGTASQLPGAVTGGATATGTGTSNAPGFDILNTLVNGAQGNGAGSAVQNATQQKTLDLLANPNAYGTQDVKDLYNWEAGNIDDQYKLQQKALGDEMARRGLGNSTINAGNLNDLNIGQRTAKETLAENLAQNYAQTANQANQAAISAGNTVGSTEQANNLNWLNNLIGYGQQGFNNDLATNAQNQGAQNAYQQFILSLLGYGQGAGA